MNVELSQRECQDLLDLLHIADVIISGHRNEDDRRSERHRALIQKLYGLARSEGLDRFISYNETANKYVPTDDFEQSTLAHTVINEFENHIFWDELISRLAARDAVQIAGGAERLNEMSDHERRLLEGPIRQRYIAEFAENGLSSLEIVERFTAGGMPVKTSD